MFVVTNREIDDSKRGLDKFGDRPNSLGPHELRVVEATKRGRGWSIDVLDDVMTPAMRREVGITDPELIYCSEYVARKLRESARRRRRHVLLYVHGFNNDMGDVLKQADALSRLYRMEVLAFSWPTRGGGAVSGTLSYKRDKAVAQLSVGALDRTIGFVHNFLTQFNGELMESVVDDACAAHPNNSAARDAAIASQAERICRYRVSALFHSMGNYLFKHALQSSAFESRQTVFDNVVLAAADTNNEGHASWVDRINARRRIFVTINEDDYALRASRMKFGTAQRARLGHYTRELNAVRPVYVDFTDVSEVGRSHSYFLDATENRAVKRFFRRAFHGENAESGLFFHPSDNLYRFRR